MKFKLIAGLGNPGREYADTYHNVGLLAIAYLVHELGAETTTKKLKKSYYYTIPGGHIVQTTTFMNASGEAIKEALTQWKVAPEELLVVHDDSDLAIGSYKITSGRGAGGHHGIESIIEVLGTNAFARLRVGIREPREVERAPAEDIVLTKISQANQEILNRLFREAFQEALGGDATKVMVKAKP